MAATAIEITKLGRNIPETFPTAAAGAADTSYGSNKYATVEYGRDDKLLLYFTAASADTVKILKGNGYAAADEDMVILNNATGTKCVVVETAKYGIDGKIVVESAGTNGKVAAVALM